MTEQSIRDARRVRALLLGGTALLLLAGAPAAAQTATPPADQASPTGDASAGQAGAPGAAAAPDTAPADAAPGDIVVTAQRREERLQDVPLSITAISGAALKNANVTDVNRLEQIAPGLRIGRSGSDARPAMRGTFTEAIQANNDPRIAFYLDDIYQSRTAQALASFVDLERVEVQKGPQGTLYGRNSFGGNIAVYSATPKDSFSAGIDGLYGNYNRRRIEGFINVPLTDGVAARFAGMYEKADGYIKNTSSGSDLGDEDQYFVRGSLKVAPSALSGLQLILRGSYWHQGGHGQGGFGYKSIGTLVDPSLVRAPGGSVTVGGVTYPFTNGFNGSTFLTGTVVPYNSRYRDGTPDVNGSDEGVYTSPDPYSIAQDFNYQRRTRMQQYNANLTYDFGPVTFRSITGYTNFFAYRSTDSDFTPAPLAYDYFQTKAKTFTQELHLFGSDQSSRFQWIVGGFYFNDRVEELGGTEQNRAYSTAIAQATGLFPLYNYSFSYNPITDCHAAGNACIAQYRSDSITPQLARTYSLAGFAQLSYRFGDKLTVTGGYRYTRDRKTFASGVGTPGFAATAPTGSTIPAFLDYDVGQQFNFACNGTQGATSASNASNYAGSLTIRCGRQDYKFSTFRGAVDYRFDRNHMLYASVSTGRHSGGFNTVADPNTLALIPFGTEKVTAFEIGTKNQFTEMFQLNIAAFYNKYRNLQAQTTIPNPLAPTASTLTYTVNALSNNTYGVEVESVLRPARNLTVNLAFNYLHSRDIDNYSTIFSYGFCAQTGGCSATSPATLGVQGAPFPNPLSNPGLFVPITNSAGQQLVNGGIPQYYYYLGTTRAAFQPTYTVNYGLAYDLELGSAGRLTPSVQSYFNSGYILTALTPNFGNQKPYTKTDVRLTYTSPSSNITLQGYVENLENEAVITRVAYGANRSLNGIYQMPRTYGIKAGFRF